MTERKNIALKRSYVKPKAQHFGTFDLETFGLGGAFADGVTWTKDGGVRHRTLESLFEAMLTPEGYVDEEEGRMPREFREFFWLAHNGARYDFAYVIKLVHEYARERGISVTTTQQGPKLIALRIDTGHGHVILLDSYPNLQSNLDKAAKTFAPHTMKLKGEIDFEGGETYDPDNERHVAYMMRDAEALYEVWKGFQLTILEAFGVMPGYTAGGTAMRAWMATIPKGHTYFRGRAQVEDFLSHFKVGGYVYPGFSTAEVRDYVTIDRTAAYAATMAGGDPEQPYGVGNECGWFPTSTAVQTFEFEPDKLGFYHVLASVPDTVDVPPFYHKGRYPYGVFETYASSELLLEAQALGCEFEVIEGYVYERVERIFDRFLSKCYKLEYPANGTVDVGRKAVAKNNRNSISGRFGMAANGWNTIIAPTEQDMLEMDCLMVLDEETGEELPFIKVAEERDAAYIQPQWYALTTERQRREMMRIQRLIPPELRGKIDTDSITMPKWVFEQLEAAGCFEMNGGYGSYKVEHDWEWLRQIGPKNYQGFDRLEEDGKAVGIVGKCKGIPNRIVNQRPELQMAAYEGVAVTVQIESMLHPLQMLTKERDVPGTKIIRKLGTSASVHGWMLNPDGNFINPVVDITQGIDEGAVPD